MIKIDQFSRGTWTRSCRHDAGPRRGVVLVAALVCLLIVSSILGGMLQGALRCRRQLHTERDLRQVELLLQAGADRAAFRLRSEADYHGEVWKIPASKIIGAADGQVAVNAARDKRDEPWQVRVVAEYPLGGQSSIRRSRTFFVQPLSSENEE